MGLTNESNSEFPGIHVNVPRVSVIQECVAEILYTIDNEYKRICKTYSGG